MPTRLILLNGATEVEGAEILVGGIAGEPLITNSRGNVTFTVDEGWEGYVDIRVEIGTGVFATATIHIVEGEDHEIQLLGQP